jgi:hypothetical protein
MIEQTKEKQALYLLQWVLWQARSMALRGESGETIAEVLDWAELLPFYVGFEKDQTPDFQEALDVLGEKFPEWQKVLRTFASPQTVG